MKTEGSRRSRELQFFSKVLNGRCMLGRAKRQVNDRRRVGGQHTKPTQGLSRNRTQRCGGFRRAVAGGAWRRALEKVPLEIPGVAGSGRRRRWIVMTLSMCL